MTSRPVSTETAADVIGGNDASWKNGNCRRQMSGRNTFTTTAKCNKVGGMRVTDQERACTKERTTNATTTFNLAQLTFAAVMHGRDLPSKNFGLFSYLFDGAEAVLRTASPEPCQKVTRQRTRRDIKPLHSTPPHSAENPFAYRRRTTQIVQRWRSEQ